MNRYIRFLFLALTLAGGCLCGSAARTPRLSVEGCRAAKIGVEVVDLRTGMPVASQNPDLLLTPASILKSVTAAAVLSDNRGQQRFQTPAYLAGQVDADGQTFRGNLVVEGHGDPTNESEFFPDYCGFADSIASRIASLGITRIDGRISVDPSAFPFPGPGRFWDADDLPWYYGAGLYPLNFKNNTARGDRALTDPAGAFTSHLASVLASHGVTLTNRRVKETPSDVRLSLYTQLSPAVTEIMRSMMVRSDNLFAEAMLRLLAPSNPVDTALQRETALLSRLGLDTASIEAFDGSGLTRKNLVTPAFMADMLTVMALGHYAYEYVGLFPRVGVEGTVEKLLADTPLQGRLVLKSGSMRSVQCFAGYKLDEAGYPTHAVVVMVNGFPPSRRTAVKKAISNFLLALFDQPANGVEPLIVRN